MAWAPDYATGDQLKGHLRLTTAAEDPELARAVTAASRAIDEYCDRQFGVVDTVEERVYETCYDRSLGLWVAEIDDLMTTTGLVVNVDGVALTAAEYRLEPRNNDKRGRPWETLLTDSATTPTLGNGPRTVEVTALWGWSSVPTTVEQACLLQAAELHTRRAAPLGIAGSPDLGSEIRLLAKLDPDVQNMLYGYGRGDGFA